MTNEGPKSQTILVVGGGIAGITSRCIGTRSTRSSAPTTTSRWCFHSQLMAVAFGMDPNTRAALDQNVIPATKLANMAKK